MNAICAHRLPADQLQVAGQSLKMRIHGSRPGELHKPIYVRARISRGGRIPAHRVVLRVAGAPDRVDRGLSWLGRGDRAISASLGCERRRTEPSESLRKAASGRRRDVHFPLLCIWLQQLVLSLVPRALCLRNGCFAVLSCFVWVGSVGLRRRVETGSWVPIGTQAKRPCVEHDSEMLRDCAIAVARRCMCMLMLHGSVWVACTPVAMHVCLAA